VGILVLIRHGQSQWNLENRFTGWTDVELTDRGRKDAKTCAKELKKRGFKFDCAFTSKLKRASSTLDIILKELRQTKIPVTSDLALNERHYGDLQGLNKAETSAKYGEKKVQEWRRSFFTRPPGKLGESMEDCGKRTLPYFMNNILPLIKEGKTVLVSAHGNSMRPIVKFLENLSPEETASREFGLCVPYVYQFEEEKVIGKEEIAVKGIVTKGASLNEKRVEEGRV